MRNQLKDRPKSTMPNNGTTRQPAAISNMTRPIVADQGIAIDFPYVK